ncbi:hypothetical protein [Streptomyces sp. MZ04]|uniref:hypothetical protein n=1 Tax=Streptomyces sp. MZ04 TaxID=2559236 RepID=UPI00107E7CF1|nr:hypothetical protein [Streptomyces sp. MZ04]TGB14734.1 hypothetical protein E2651_05005 [Streptomyces sp. MZ04]
MAMRTRKVVVILMGTVCVLVVAVSVMVVGAHLLTGGYHMRADRFDTGAEAKSARESMPRWLPDGAKDISWNWATTGRERKLKATLPSGALPQGCTAGRPDRTPEVPEVKAGWFPKDAAKKAAARCGSGTFTYYAYLDRRTLIAWLNTPDEG